LILAVNVGTDPPDIVKPHPCAVLQCWIDPSKYSRVKAKELIGERLEAQYAKWQLARKAGPGGLKYRRALDPTVEDVRNLCLRLRSQARGERILLHYNGHGVPRPSDHGEIWVFDKNHTEYIPLPVADLKLWMGSPAIVVLDCSAAGILVPHFTAQPGGDDTSTGGNSVSSMNSGANGNGNRASSPISVPLGGLFPLGAPRTSPPTAKLHATSFTDDMDEQASQWVRDTIVLCPCSENEWLPMHPDYPADIFTSCLTTPIPMALRWFIHRNPASMSGLNPETADSIPGVANDRKTPLGELNWIFTTVTDSIAWNILPKPLFARLFRQDLLVASLFRNFLLADRILRSMGCTPVSFPPLPRGAADHPLWQAWDLACETVLFQLMQDGILGNHVLTTKTQSRRSGSDSYHDHDTADVSSTSGDDAAANTTPTPVAVASSISSPFFSEQLAAFEVWLEFAEIHVLRLSTGGPAALDPPEHLPVVLQVLLSQVHRIRALTLLRRFLVLGPWAVNLSLRLGIFPYVMKLLQSPEYKSLLVCIWASILAFDPSCRVDLLKDGALHHFVQHFMWGLGSAALPAEEAAKERTLAAFILSIACHDFPGGQSECARLSLLSHCTSLLSSYEQGERTQDRATEVHMPPHFRLWVCICLANLVKDNAPIQTEAYNADVHHRLAVRMQDRNADVRAAVCYAVGSMIGGYKGTASRVPSAQDLSVQLQQQGYLGFQPTQGGITPPRLGLGGTVHSVPSLGSSGRSTFSSMGLSNVQFVPQQLDALRSLPGIQPMTILQNQSMAVQGGALWNQPQNLQPEPGQSAMGHQMVGSRSSGMLASRDPLITQPRQPSLGNLPSFHQQSPFPSSKPTVFEDRHRLDLDLLSLETILLGVKDGSVIVRYEATIALGGLVAKYLDAFVSVAEEFSVSKTASLEVDAPRVRLPLPRGLQHEDLERFRPAWFWLRSLQRDDPFPSISKAANAVVSVVHETLLRYKAEVARHSAGSNGASQLSGIDEDTSVSPGASETLPLSPSGFKFVKTDLRRVSSEVSYKKGRMVSMEDNAETNHAGRIAGSTKVDEVSSYSFPKSQFFGFKKDAFDPNFKSLDDDDRQELDPLSPEGAARQYQYRRNYLAREQGDELFKRYACLAPKPPKPAKKSIQMILEEEEVDESALRAADEHASARKFELEFKEDILCRNDGVKMTSLVDFHPYENYLMACGDTGIISMWNTQSGKRRTMFSNGNPKRSRMTSSCWINAESASHFMVGCDDGTVRVWGDLLESCGECPSTHPKLLASFRASTMEADNWGSGLVSEWQNYSGTLIAGGNSKFIRCWDLEAEKVVNKLATNSDAYVTTLTTAWDNDKVGSGSDSQAMLGIGKHVVVAGLSNGLLKLFDIRTNGGSQHSEATLSEHKSWVVTTAFTCYAGRYELISGTLSGEIKAWDLRMSSSIRTVEVQRSTMTALAVHPRIPIAATGSEAQFIKIVALDGDTMQLLRYHEKLANHRIGPVSCVAFHPFKPLLAAGATDSYIGIYSTRRYAQETIK
jgi:Raptor N-terminal CASPase like domain/WD domain, G-beta repeat